MQLFLVGSHFLMLRLAPGFLGNHGFGGTLFLRALIHYTPKDPPGNFVLSIGRPCLYDGGDF